MELRDAYPHDVRRAWVGGHIVLAVGYEEFSPSVSSPDFQSASDHEAEPELEGR